MLGGVEAERVNQEGLDQFLVEGRDDASHRHRAPRGVTNGTHRHNVHLSSFAADINDPSERFQHIISGYQSLDRISEAIVQSFTASSQPRGNSAPLPRSVIEIARDHQAISQMHENATTDSDRAFYQRALDQLSIELCNLTSGISETE